MDREVDFNPDHHPSSSALWAEQRDESVIEVLQVKQHGVLVLTADDDPLSFRGLSIFSDADIGWKQ